MGLPDRRHRTTRNQKTLRDFRKKIIGFLGSAFIAVCVMLGRAPNCAAYIHTDPAVPKVSFSSHKRVYTFHGSGNDGYSQIAYDIRGVFDIDTMTATEKIEVVNTSIIGIKPRILISRVKCSADPYLFIGASRNVLHVSDKSGVYEEFWNNFLVRKNLPIGRRLISGADKKKLLDKALLEARYLEIASPKAYGTVPYNHGDIFVKVIQALPRDLVKQGIVQYSQKAMVTVEAGNEQVALGIIKMNGAAGVKIMHLPYGVGRHELQIRALPLSPTGKISPWQPFWYGTPAPVNINAQEAEESSANGVRIISPHPNQHITDRLYILLDAPSRRPDDPPVTGRITISKMDPKGYNFVPDEIKVLTRSFSLDATQNYHEEDYPAHTIIEQYHGSYGGNRYRLEIIFDGNRNSLNKFMYDFYIDDISKTAKRASRFKANGIALGKNMGTAKPSAPGMNFLLGVTSPWDGETFVEKDVPVHVELASGVKWLKENGGKRRVQLYWKWMPPKPSSHHVTIARDLVFKGYTADVIFKFGEFHPRGKWRLLVKAEREGHKAVRAQRHIRVLEKNQMDAYPGFQPPGQAMSRSHAAGFSPTLTLATPRKMYRVPAHVALALVHADARRAQFQVEYRPDGHKHFAAAPMNSYRIIHNGNRRAVFESRNPGCWRLRFREETAGAMWSAWRNFQVAGIGPVRAGKTKTVRPVRSAIHPAAPAIASPRERQTFMLTGKAVWIHAKVRHAAGARVALAVQYAEHGHFVGIQPRINEEHGKTVTAVDILLSKAGQYQLRAKLTIPGAAWGSWRKFRVDRIARASIHKIHKRTKEIKATGFHSKGLGMQPAAAKIR